MSLTLPAPGLRTGHARHGRRRAPFLWARPVVALLLIGAAYVGARPRTAPVPSVETLAGRICFAAPTPLPGTGTRTVRALHPSYAPIDGWISSVGAAVSLGSLSADDGGLQPLRAVWVDPRDDRVTEVEFERRGDAFAAREVAELAVEPGDEVAASAPMGSVIGDFDGDGGSEVLVYYWGRLPVIFQHGGRRWERRTPLRPAELGVDETRWFTNAVCQADVDGDGRPDLIVGNYFPARAEVLDGRSRRAQEMQASMSRAENGGRNRVLLNRSEPGRIRFVHAPIHWTDVEASPAIDRARLDGWTLALAAGDLNGDLLPEIYVANDFGPDLLLVNESSPGVVRFRLARGSPGAFTPRSKVLGRDSFKGMGAEFATLAPNEAGFVPSLLVSNIAESWALLESHFAFQSDRTPAEAAAMLAAGSVPYRDRSEPLGLSRSGWGWDIKAADFDNDGWPEVVQALGFLQGRRNGWALLQEVATGNDFNLSHLWSWHHFRTGAGRTAAHDDKLSGDSHTAFFYRAGSGPFAEVGASLRAGGQPAAARVFPSGTVTRGIATGDIDRDGRIDLVLANQWQTSFAYRNVAPAAGRHATFRIVRAVSGHRPVPGLYPAAAFAALAREEGWRTTPVIGATVEVRQNGRLIRAGAVDGGNGHSGRRPAEVHFGLGAAAADEPLQVDVRWRRGAGAAAGPVGHLRAVFAGARVGEPGLWIAVVEE